MPAEFDTGMFVREPAWHGLGVVLDDFPQNWADARVAAGLEWEPIERGVYDVTEMYADGTAKVELIEDFKQVVRSDTGARLDIATSSYELIEHSVMGEIVDAVMDAGKDDGVKYETAGSLEGGKRVWALARVGGITELPGDPSPLAQYVALLNSHDGSAALKVINTDVRIVCANTWHAAEVDSERRGAAYSFRHTRNWRDKVEQAKKALTAAKGEHEATMAAARAMLEVKVTKAQREEFIKQFTIHRVLQSTVGKEKFTRMELAARLDQPRVKKSIGHVTGSLNTILGGPTCDGIRDTMYGLVQAGGEFADWYRDSASNESLFSRNVLANEPLKLAAVKIAEKVLTSA